MNDLETNKKLHPDYDKYRKYYNDVKLEALRCQGGLCAYTEMRLCDISIFSEDKWENGRCKTKRKIESFGQLDHFDPTLKKEKGWLWSNFFVVNDHINTVVKHSKSVDYIIKPDSDDYDPFDKIKFDTDTNMFVPNDKKTPKEQARIREMIVTLGINYEPVRTLRKFFIKQLRTTLEFGHYDPTDYQNTEFPTTLSFILEEEKTLN